MKNPSFVPLLALLCSAAFSLHGQEASFDDLVIGEINGQGSWTVDAADSAKALVAESALTYTASDGVVYDGGTRHLELVGNPSAKMDGWATLPLDPVADGETYVRALIYSSDKGTAADSGELFMRLAGWSLYVGAKFFDGVIELPGGNTLEVDTTNGLPLDVTHMVVLKLTVAGGVVTGVDLWLNPAFADSASPDLSVGGLSIDAADITQLELRSQNTLTRVDEFKTAGAWGNVVFETTPFTGLNLPFDDYSIGLLNGQDGWSVDAADLSKAIAIGGNLVYTASDGAVLSGGTKHLLLSGSASAKMNGFASRPIDPSPDGTTYVRAMVFTSDKGTDIDPGEVFLRLAGWDLYVAAKFYAGVIELPGGNILEVDTTNGLPLNVAHLVVLKLTAAAGVVTGVDLWLNPSEADEASPDLSVTGLNVDLSTIQTLEVRSQNTLTRLDEIKLAAEWLDVVPQVPVIPFDVLEENFDNLNVGEINGQGDWSIEAADSGKANVAANALTYNAADGAILEGGTQHLELTGAPNDKMNAWLTLPVEPELDDTTYARALIFSSDKGTSADPGELIIRLAGWDLYVAAKFHAGIIELPGGNTLEVDTTNGLPLDVAHMVLLRLNEEGGAITSVDLWLNPDFADEASPDLTVGGLSVDLSAIPQLELRSQNTLTRVDELKLAESWAEVVPEKIVVPFDSLEAGFDDLTTGEINGQGGWSIGAADSAKATVEANALTFTGPNEEVLDGGTQHLALTGSPLDKMDEWLILPVDPPLDDTTYARALIFSSDKGTSADPGELFIRLAGWDLYVAAKFHAGIIELPGGNTLEVDTTNGLPLDVAHLVVLRMNVEAGIVTSVDFWLNPGFLDQATPDLTVDSLSLDLSAISQVELRSQNTLTRVDELKLAEAWDAVVPAPPPNPFELAAYQFENYNSGILGGQDGWTAPGGVTVTSSTFDYTTPEGLAWTGGMQALELAGSTASPINDWAARGLDTFPPDETFFISYHAMVSDNGTEDPSELFIRNAGWDLFSALKVTDDIFELNGEQYTEAGLAYDTPVHVVLEATVSDGLITTLKGWLNPVQDDDPDTNRDQQPMEEILIEGLSIPLTALTGFELRSQKAVSVVDDLIMTENWAECFQVRKVRITPVRELGTNVQWEGIEDTAIGEGLSPHDPAEEPPSIPSVPFIDFQNALGQAYDKGLGGVADFEKENVTVTSGLEWAAAATSIAQINEIVIPLGERDISITLGVNAHVEGGCADGYTGKECPVTDFLNPSPPIEDGYGLWSIGERTNASSGASTLGGHNSFDFDFDPADQLVMVSLTYINWDNFQSHRETKPFPTKPNVRVRATFTNGVEDVVQLSTGLTEQTGDPYNTFFGFEAPAGYYLKRLELYTVGNNARLWPGIDDLAVVAESTDLYTFTFNNEGTVGGKDRPIQDANWDGIYSSAALPLVTGEAVFADLSEGVTDDTTPGHFKAGFLFVSGKNEQPAPEGFLVYSTNTAVVDVVQEPYGSGINPQTDWYSDPPNEVIDLGQLTFGNLRELQMRIRPKNPEAVRYHFAIKAGGEWYIGETALQHSGEGSDWESVSVLVPDINWLSGVVGQDSLNLDFTANPPTVVTADDIGGDTPFESVGIYIDTDDGVGQTDTWARVDSITLSATLPEAAPPTITGQPASLTLDEGDTAEFTVTVLETENISYQWRKDGTDIDGATSATLSITGVTPADNGSYDVLVTGPGGIALSDAATLTVYPAPTLDTDLVEIGPEGGSAFITVTAVPEVSWTAGSQSPWITITFGSSGTGSDLVGLQIAANDSYDARSGSVLVAGTVVTVNQDGQPVPDTLEAILEATDNGDGTFTSPWFGTYAETGTGWIDHADMGLIHADAVERNDTMYLYMLDLRSWAWTSKGAWPAMYAFSENGWITYVIVDGYGFVYDYETGDWIF